MLTGHMKATRLVISARMNGGCVAYGMAKAQSQGVPGGGNCSEATSLELVRPVSAV